jgi:hypothetical protein
MRHKFALLVLIFTGLSLSVGCNSSGTINVKAALVYKIGSAQPIARTKLYLLKEDMIAKEKYFYNDPMQAEVSGKLKLDPTFANVNLDTSVGIKEDVIKDFVITTAMTDFEGNAKFENLPLGTYYIIGFTRTRSELGSAVWNVKVDLNKTTEAVFLDQNNALKIKN